MTPDHEGNMPRGWQPRGWRYWKALRDSSPVVIDRPITIDNDTHATSGHPVDGCFCHPCITARAMAKPVEEPLLPPLRAVVSERGQIEEIYDAIAHMKQCDPQPDTVIFYLDTWSDVIRAELAFLGIHLREETATRVLWVNELRKEVGKTAPKNKVGAAVISDVDLLTCTLDQRRAAFWATIETLKKRATDGKAVHGWSDWVI